MNEMWAVVQWDAELEQWNRKCYYYHDAAKKGMIDWVKAELDCFEQEYTFMKDDAEVLVLNEWDREIGVIRTNTATLDVKGRGMLEWYMFRVC